MSVDGGAGPGLEETEMIYSVMGNKSKAWAPELCRAEKADCRLPLAVGT